jgi:HSP20 family protein
MKRTLFEGFSREMEGLMERFFGEQAPGKPSVFSPATNMAETGTHYEVAIDLPGVKHFDVKVEVHDGELRVSGERQTLHEEKDKTFHLMERTYGRFQRKIKLPGGINEEGIEAKYKDGVLTILLPKSEKSQARQIDVQG